MDGINRYFQPNTLDGLSIYESILPGEPLYVDGSNAMQADADMGGHNVKNVATATANDEAVNLGQMNLALLAKADTSYVNTQLATKADTTYVNTQDNLRVLKSGDTMTGALSMSNNAIHNVATATATHQAVNLGQVQSITGSYVTLNTTQTITAVKTFTVLPESSMTATTANQLVNRQTVINYIPFDNFGLVHFSEGRNTDIYYATLYACNIGTFTSPLASRTYNKGFIYGTTVTLVPRVTYYGCVVRCDQTFQMPPPVWTGPTIKMGLYDIAANRVAVSNAFECVDTTVQINGGYRNFFVPFTTPYTPSVTETFIVAMLITSSSNWNFTGAETNNGDIFQTDLATIGGFPFKAHQKGWASTASYTDLPTMININVDSAVPFWVGLTGIPNNYI